MHPKSQTLLEVHITIECIVLLYLLYFTVQLLNPARCIYSQKGVTKVGLKKTIFNLAWDDIEAVYCMRFIFFPFFSVVVASFASLPAVVLPVIATVAPYTAPPAASVRISPTLMGVPLIKCSAT